MADLYRRRVDPAAHARLDARCRALGLDFSEEELLVLAALDHPGKVQDFLNTQIYYNYDHPTLDHPVPDLEETAMPPRRILQTARAHCFEGACFAYAVNYLHGHDPRWVLLEGSQDPDHNLILYRDPVTGLYGVNAHSGYVNLVGQPARFPSIRAIAEYYFQYYYSDHTLDPNDVMMVGYSEPIDLVARYGVAWMASDAMLWEIYYTFVDDAVQLHYVFDDSDQTHLYPLVRAVQAGWIRMDGEGHAALDLTRLPPPVKPLWAAFWENYDPATVLPRGAARAFEMRFFALTGTTPLDLQSSRDELTDYLEHGYRIEQIVHR